MTRLPTGLLVAALLRRVHDAGGSAVVLAKGDPEAGAVLVLPSFRGVPAAALERGIGPSGATQLIRSGPDPIDSQAFADWLDRRRARDPDLWVVELDVADSERFAAETILFD